MWGYGIAIGGVAALTIAAGAVAWVGTRSSGDTVEVEGMLIARNTLDEIVDAARDDKFVCAKPIQGEFMGATELGNIYRVSCASLVKGQSPDRFRITVRPYTRSTVEPW